MFRIICDATRLTARERTLALRALGWLVTAHLALRACAFPSIRRALERIPSRRLVRRVTPADCERAMTRAVRVFPSANCLARALAAATLLRREGLMSVLNIRVAFDDRQRFQAHAWLESEGRVVTGAGELVDGQPLLRERIPPTS